MKVSFKGSMGDTLSARLDLPPGPVRAYAVFAHCFTCSKDLTVVREISKSLALHGIAVLGFDFTGLGSSEGDFANTNFSSNVEDLSAAIAFVEEHYGTVELLIGHSLGGAAVVAAAGDCSQLKAVATIGAPADANHVAHLFEESLDEIAAKGEAQACIGGRTFKVRQQFLDDLNSSSVVGLAAELDAALMVLHSPVDETVGIENAKGLFDAAKHPKSFVSLNTADHLVTDRKDARYAAEVIAAWASQYVSDPPLDDHDHPDGVTITETGLGKFQNIVHAGKHHLLADEPTSVGGADSGPGPYEYLTASLGACTAMTLRMYSDHKGYDFGKIAVSVTHDRVHASDCQDCSQEIKDKPGKIDKFERFISIDGLPADLVDKVLAIADKCPVHKTLEASSVVATSVQ